MDQSASCLIVASAFIFIATVVLAWRWRHELIGLAAIDYLLLAPIVLSVLFVVLPLLALPHPGKAVTMVAQGSCAVSATLIAAYPFAVIDRQLRRKGATEGALFAAGCALAGLGAIAIFWYC